MSDAQLFLSMGIPTLAVLIGILVNHWQVSAINTRISDSNARAAELRQDMNTGFEDLKSVWRSELHRVEEVLDARLKHMEER